MDAFFASVEQRDNPELKGKPVVVGGNGKRSVVAAASYEARSYGIISAMPMSMAKQKCRDLIVTPTRFQVYKEVSSQIRQIFREYTDLVEPLSLDEAYLDVTENKLGMRSATLIAEEIRDKVWKKTRLTCSAGVSVNKFLAKVASDVNKPNGLTTIAPPEIDGFLASLPISKFYGVGKVTTKKMHALGVKTGGDLRKMALTTLVKHFGKSGTYYHNVCRGVDDRTVSPTRLRKSISVERTFEDNIHEEVEAQKVLEQLCQDLSKALARLDVQGRTFQLKWRYPDFSTPTRSKSFLTHTNDSQLILSTFSELFKENVDLAQGVRLIGVGMTNLNTNEDSTQLMLEV
ncbi:UNVERIFIED_CONTAM: hypothetical protein GTU68_035751 [Idotea baltica]|nr:hypothetical protein [Idotea baltica]